MQLRSQKGPIWFNIFCHHLRIPNTYWRRAPHFCLALVLQITWPALQRRVTKRVKQLAPSAREGVLGQWGFLRPERRGYGRDSNPQSHDQGSRSTRGLFPIMSPYVKLKCGNCMTKASLAGYRLVSYFSLNICRWASQTVLIINILIPDQAIKTVKHYLEGEHKLYKWALSSGRWVQGPPKTAVCVPMTLILPPQTLQSLAPSDGGRSRWTQSQSRPLHG